jgi:hypothetical protein
LPIAASNRITEHDSVKPRQDGHDYVEGITPSNRAEQGKRDPTNRSST